MITEIVQVLTDSAEELLTQLPGIFSNVVSVLYTNGALTDLGQIVVATAGFALAWAGIRFIFGFVNRLLNKSRAGR